ASSGTTSSAAGSSWGCRRFSSGCGPRADDRLVAPRVGSDPAQDQRQRGGSLLPDSDDSMFVLVELAVVLASVLLDRQLNVLLREGDGADDDPGGFLIGAIHRSRQPALLVLRQMEDDAQRSVAGFDRALPITDQFGTGWRRAHGRAEHGKERCQEG